MPSAKMNDSVDETPPSPLSHEDSELDRLWRQTFGEPLPIRHSAALVRQILADASRSRE